MIIVKPNGGLGNRMRVIHSAILLSKLHNAGKVKVLWKKDAGLNAGFFELFEPTPQIEVVENIALMGLYFYGAKKLMRYEFIDDVLAERYRFDKTFWNERSKNILLNTCFDFLSSDQMENYYSMFKPIKNIQEKIEELIGKFTTNTIGVQIRRTDHVVSKENSKIEYFVGKMKQMLNQDESTSFFLTTDDVMVEEKLRGIFEERIILQADKDLNRNSLDGIKAAVIDMYGLSVTKHILGSYSSSFGEVAAGIGKKSYEMVTNKPD